MKTFSVFLPNYNHEKYLRRCLDSIVTQERLPDQLVFVDDASTDNSLEIAREYQKKYSFIEIYPLEKNLGANGAVSFAIAQTRCDYIYGVAADDYVLPGWFSKMMEGAELHPEAGIIFGNSLVTRSDGSRSSISEYRPQGDPYLLNSSEFWKFVVQEKYYTYISAACLYKKNTWEAVGGYRCEMGHYCDNFALNTIGLLYGACHVAHLGHAFVQYGDSFSSGEMSNTQKLIDIAHEIESRLKFEPFSRVFDNSMRIAWSSEMRKRAIRTPIWKEVLKKVIEREKKKNEVFSSNSSSSYKGAWWVYSKFLGIFWKLQAYTRVIVSSIKWASYRPKVSPE